MRLGILTLLVFIGGCAAGAPIAAPDGKVLMALVQEQVDMGPRVPGSAAHDRWLARMRERLRGSGARLSVQSFTDTVPGFGPATLSNVLASFGPDTGRALLVCAHWDSRPRSDRDPDTTLRHMPLPGANDGGSGVAVLLALAERLHGSPPPRRVDLVFLDGEDLGTAEHPEAFFRGSTYFAAHLPVRYSAGVLLDMVGGRGARFTKEPNSLMAAPDVVRRVWEEAARQKLDAFSDEVGPTIGDDHLPLNRAGVPTADVIDISYPEWHTTADLPAAMAPEGMQACYRVLAALAARP